MTRIAIIIPSRMGSTRFPGKPLARIAGHSMIRRVHAIASAVPGIAAVHVATEAEEILEHVQGFGGSAVLTPASCANGTERVHAALAALDERYDAVLNFQGDAVLTPPWILEAVARVLAADPSAGIVTPACRLNPDQIRQLQAAKAGGEAGGTTVTFDRDWNALYFSKAVIPFLRHAGAAPPVWRHIGLYGYTVAALAGYLALPPGRFEQAEGLEQLRALEGGMRIRVVETDYLGRTPWSVDAPGDVPVAEALIQAEGELVPDRLRD